MCSNAAALPIIPAFWRGRWVQALVDTGSERSLVLEVGCKRGMTTRGYEKENDLFGPGGNVIHVEDVWTEKVGVGGMEKSVDLYVLANGELGGFGATLLLGVDYWCQFGLVKCVVRGDEKWIELWKKPFEGVGAVQLKEQDVLRVDDVDFEAGFNGKFWEVRWKWKVGEPKLRGRIGEYASTKREGVFERYEDEVKSWIAKGWLVEVGKSQRDGIIPLMAVEQPTKNKVRPVMDYRELNRYVESHTGDDEIAVCGEKLREWRKKGENLAIVDLKSAYLQVRVARELWDFQRVRFKGTEYVLTRLGFGLCSAPRIMQRILKKVLEQDRRICEATDHYVDDIVVECDKVRPEEVRKHVGKYGFVTKEPEHVAEGRVLGLKLLKNREGRLIFVRGNEVRQLSSEECKVLTKKELFSVCGQLVGHYPVAGWLRVATSYCKRHCQADGWGERISELSAKMMWEVYDKVQRYDPVRGVWDVSGEDELVVWTDASIIAQGVVCESSKGVVEDMAWLRKKDDVMHINVAELEAAARGINMAVKWGPKRIHLKTDSATVCGWLHSVLTGESRVKTSGAAEMLVKRRLATLRQIIDEYELDVRVALVHTDKNKADELTRVPKKWIEWVKRVDGEKVMADGVVRGLVVNAVHDLDRGQLIQEVHDRCHFGVLRTRYLVRQAGVEDVSMDEVKNVVRNCRQCVVIDPAPVLGVDGELSVAETWWRLAVDVTHYDHKKFFSLVDCGPSRFTVWRKLYRETGDEIAANIEEIFRERGPPAELLLDNSLSFHSAVVGSVCHYWGVWLRF